MEISRYILSGNLLGIWVTLLIGVAGLLLAKIDLRHRRVWPRIAITALLVGIPTLLAYFHYPVQWVFVSSLLVLLVVILLLATIRWPLPHESLLLFWVSKISCFRQGQRDKILGTKFFCFFLTSPGKIHLLRELITKCSRSAFYGTLIHQLIQRYAGLPLFESEKAAFEFNQGIFYLQMGATNKIQQILDGASDYFKRTSKYYYLLAHVAKVRGQLDQERECLEKALFLQVKDDSLQCILYNNIAVNAGARGNHTDVIHFYSKAVEILGKHPSFNMKHTVIPNMINIYLLDGERSKVESLLDTYRSMIDFRNIDDVMMWGNYRLTYYRQCGDLNKAKKVYEDGAAHLPVKLTPEERLAFQINELRMRWNNRIEWEQPLNNVCRHLEEYFALPFPESFLAVKELCFIMSGLDEQQNPLYDSDIVKKLIDFLRKTAPELDLYLRSLPDEFVHERFNLTKDKAWLLQIFFDPVGKSPEQNDKEYTIMLDKKLAVLNDLVDIQLKAGNILNAMDARLGIADEVISQIFSPYTAGFFNRPRFYDYRQKLLDLSKRQMDIAYSELTKFGSDTSILDKKLRLAFYFMQFSKVDKAYRLYRDFEDSGISINHFSDWIRSYHDKLRSAFTVFNAMGKRQPSTNA